MGACRHNNYNHDDGGSHNHDDGGSYNHDDGGSHNHDDCGSHNHDDCAAGRGTADGWASRPGYGFTHLHRITAVLAQGLRRGTGRNRAEFCERNRRILPIPLSGGFVEICLACCGAGVGAVGRSVITPFVGVVTRRGGCALWGWVSTGCVCGFGIKG